MRLTDKLQVKAQQAAKCLPLVGLAKSKQDPINRGHGAQYLNRPPPAAGPGAIDHHHHQYNLNNYKVIRAQASTTHFASSSKA